MPHATGLSGSSMLDDRTFCDSTSSLSVSVRSTVSTAGNTVSGADTGAEFPLSRLFGKGSVVALDGSKLTSYTKLLGFLSFYTSNFKYIII